MGIAIQACVIKMKVQYQEIRFGTCAVKEGFVTPDQVVKAIEIQVREDLSTGRHKAIGEILLEQGIISRSELDDILHIMYKRGGRSSI